ncbi:hypothetical protein EDB92DRAFT_1815424 [Lactarius akahatsu]|uniref:Uncharacterized protein n=1 Tax=Lactarius akahatsu TaxID=416441 RepID=A0AAD4QEM6_9AGAM|nr:hypothetical protein EDB92DRAFT_1815424 [Lactarius akahatsu]
MSTETGASILDGVLICIGNRISAILLNPADKDENFSDIRDPGTYTTHNGNQKLNENIQASAIPQFNFMEWWKIGEGVEMKEPFDVGDELVAGLFHALEMEAGSRLHARVTERFKRAWQLSENIKSRCNSLYHMFKDANYIFEAEAIHLENENSR